MKGLKYMNNVLFRRGNQTFIDKNVPLNDGQIIFNETDEAIYVDTLINGSVVRKRYGGGNLSRSDIDMALSTVSENPVANKVLTALMLQKADVIDDLGTALVVTKNGVPTGCKTIQGLNTKINTTQAQVSNSDDAYSSTRPYAVGELCIYNNVLYRCTTACSAGSWATNQSCFTSDTLVRAVNGINDNYNIKGWTKLYIANGSAGISLNPNWSEAIVVCTFGANPIISFPYRFLRSQVEEMVAISGAGFAIVAASTGEINNKLKFSATGFVIDSMTFGGGEYKTTSRLTIWYR